MLKNTKQTIKQNAQKDVSQLGLSGKRMVGGVLVDWNPLEYLGNPTTSHKVYYR